MTSGRWLDTALLEVDAAAGGAVGYVGILIGVPCETGGGCSAILARRGSCARLGSGGPDGYEEVAAGKVGWKGGRMLWLAAGGGGVD